MLYEKIDLQNKTKLVVNQKSFKKYKNFRRFKNVYYECKYGNLWR